MLRVIAIAGCVLLCLGWGMAGEVIDRLAITVGPEVITELQLDEELRIAALMNHKVVARDLEARRAAGDRLVEQLLIRHEMELSRFPLPDEQDVSAYFGQLREQNGGASEFEIMLSSYDLTEQTLREHLELQLTALRFIGYRFRPDAAVSDADIEAAYKRQTAGWSTGHTGDPPSLEVSREPLRLTLIEERTDVALNSWLAESRKQVNIVYLDKALQ